MIVNGDDVILENEKKLFSIIIYLYNCDIHFEEAKKIIPDMPDYCRKEYNDFYKSIYDAIKNKFTNEI